MMARSRCILLTIVYLLVPRDYVQACDTHCVAAIRNIVQDELNKFKNDVNLELLNEKLGDIHNRIDNVKNDTETLKQKLEDADNVTELIFDTNGISLKVGEEATLDCNVKGSFSSCHWEHYGHIYQVDTVMSGAYPNMRKISDSGNDQCSIVITNVTTAHGGDWTCNVLTSEQNLTSSKALSIDNTVILSDGSETLLYVGQEATLVCYIPNVTRKCHWKHYRHIYHMSDVAAGIFTDLKAASNSSNNQCSLSIKSISKIHHGIWTCAEEFKQPHSSNMTLKVEMNKLNFDASDIYVYIGQEIMLECGVNGILRSCHWEHADQIYKISEIRAGSHTNMKIASKSDYDQCSILITSFNDEHEGEWTCLVQTSGKNFTSSRNLTVEKTDIQFNKSAISSHIGDELHLECGVLGYYSSCEWIHGNLIYQVADVANGLYSNMMAANNSISNTTDSINDAIDSDSNQCSIIINSATTTHNGMWTCKVLTRGQPLNSSKTITIGCPHGYHLASGSDQCYKMGCPKGFFTLSSTTQCFKFFNETKVSWEEANTKCQENGMELAKPYDALTLRRYLVERYGHDSRAWIGAKGDGQYLRWNRDGSYLTTSNPLWYSGHPSSNVKSNYCLYLLASDSNMKSYPNQPFVSSSCTTQYRPLCELVMD